MTFIGRGSSHVHLTVSVAAAHLHMPLSGVPDSGKYLDVATHALVLMVLNRFSVDMALNPVSVLPGQAQESATATQALLFLHWLLT